MARRELSAGDAIRVVVASRRAGSFTVSQTVAATVVRASDKSVTALFASGETKRFPVSKVR